MVAINCRIATTSIFTLISSRRLMLNPRAAARRGPKRLRFHVLRYGLAAARGFIGPPSKVRNSLG